MTDQTPGDPVRTSEALKQWREAERVVAVARRGRLAAEVSAAAAAEAADAAVATADAAKTALAASTLAEASAAKTAAAARVMVQVSRADHADADAELAIAEIGEAEARERYRAAESAAQRRAQSEPT